MSEEPKPPSWVQALTLMVMLVERFGWPVVFIAALMSGFASKLLDLLLKLLEAGPVHFWSFLALVLGSTLVGGLIRRQTATVRRQSRHIEDLIVVSERLIERRDEEPPQT